MDKKPYTSLEHSIRNIMTESISPIGSDEFKGTPKAFLKPAPRIAPKKGDTHPDGTAVLAQRGAAKIGQSKSGGTMSEEEVLDERYAGGQKSLKPTEKQKQDMETNLKNLPGAIDAGIRGAASSATFGAADHIAAAGDYAVKNTLGRLFGGQGTTYEKEYQQELEKTAKAQKEHPTAYAAGEWAPLVAGGVKAGVSAAKGLYNIAKATPEALRAIGAASKTPVKSAVQGVTAIAKDFTKPIGTAAVDLAKGNVKKAGGEIAKYAKDIPSTAKSLAGFGAGLEGTKQLVHSAVDPEKKKELFKPGGATKLAQDVGKAGAEMAAPGSVEAVKKASEGKWKEAGKETARAVTGATIVNPSFSRFVYDAATGYLKPELSITGEKGVSDKLYDKATKKKISESNSDIIKRVRKKSLLEGGNAVKTGEAVFQIGSDILKLFSGGEKAAAEAAVKARAKAAAEAAARAKAAGTNIVRPEFPSAGAAKPKKAPPAEPTAPPKEKPVKPDNDNPKPIVKPTWPDRPFSPDTSPKPLGPPANPAPGKPTVPKFKPPPDMPPPANPKKVEPEKPAAPVKKPEPGIPGNRPAPTVNPVETKPKVTPTEVPALPVDPRINPKFLPGNRPAPAAEPAKAPAPAPINAPDSLPNPAADPLRKPISQPLAEPVPAAQPAPAQKAADNAVVTKTQPEKKPEKKEETKKHEETKKTEVKPPKRRIIPFGLKIPGVSADVLSGLRGFVPAHQYVHFEPQGFIESNEADNIRKTIENVARPGGKTRIAKQGEIKAKIIDENAKRAAVIKQTVKDSTIIKNPKLKHPELDEN